MPRSPVVVARGGRFVFMYSGRGRVSPDFRNIGRSSPDKGHQHMARRTAPRWFKIARRCFILHAGCRNVLIKVGEGEGDHFSSAVRCGLPRTVAGTLYEKSRLGALICLDSSSFLTGYGFPMSRAKEARGAWPLHCERHFEPIKVSGSVGAAR